MYLMDVMEIPVSPQIILATISLLEELPIQAPINELKVKDVDAMKLDAPIVLFITVNAAPLLIAST